MASLETTKPLLAQRPRTRSISKGFLVTSTEILRVNRLPEQRQTDSPSATYTSRLRPIQTVGILRSLRAGADADGHYPLDAKALRWLGRRFALSARDVLDIVEDLLAREYLPWVEADAEGNLVVIAWPDHSCGDSQACAIPTGCMEPRFDGKAA